MEEIEQAVAMRLPTLASMLVMPIRWGLTSTMLAATPPLGEGGYSNWGLHAVPASAAAVADLEKKKFVAGSGGRDDGNAAAAEGCSGGATSTGCSICLEEFEDGEEVIVMPCSRAHEFHANCVTRWLGIRNTCPLCRRRLTTSVGGDGQ